MLNGKKMKQIGIVIEINGEYAKVECDRQSACDMCENSSGCTEKCKKVYAKARNSVNAEIGDTVEIETETSKVLMNAFIVFFLPVLLSLCAYFVAERFFGSALAVVTTLVVLIVSLVLFAFLLNRSAKNKDVSRIVRIFSK